MNNASMTAVLCGDLNLIRCLAGKGIATTLISSEPDDLTFQSRYCHRRVLIADPRTQPEHTLQDLLALGRALPGKPALLYDNEPMMLLVSRNRAVLAEYYRFLLPEPELVEDMANKVRFTHLAERLELPVPRTLLSRQISSAQAAAACLSLPCIFKPVSHVGWYGTEVVRQAGGKPFKALLASTSEQFASLWEKMTQCVPDFVVQEYIPGPDDCIYSFHAYLDRNSTPLGYYVGKKIRTYPKCSGISTYLELVHEPQLVKLGLEILAKLKYVGAVKLDFKKDTGRNRFYLLEINSRFNLWNHLGAACGINLPYIACLDLYGRPCPPLADYRTGIRWLSFGNDLRTFLLDYHRDGDLSWSQYLKSFRGPKVYDVFSWRDTRPWVISSLRYVKSQLRKRLRFPRHSPSPALSPAP
jgi:predicted ATP-grasp superfamily ATP-dependent carboligase